MSAWTFDTGVEYYLSTHPPIATPTSNVKKKRRSGLDLLRPKSFSSGKIPTDSPAGLMFSYSLPATANPTGYPHDTPLSPLNRAHNDLQSAQDATYKVQRAHLKLLKHSPSLALIKPIGELETFRLTAPERDMSLHWVRGRVHVSLYGEGGRQGGDLFLFREDERHASLTFPIPAIDDDQHAPTWSITDIQNVHQSVSHRPHALAIKILSLNPEIVPTSTPSSPSPRNGPVGWQDESSSGSSPASSVSSRMKVSRPHIADVRKSLAIVERKPWNKGAMPELERDIFGQTTNSMSSLASISDPVLYLAFESERERGEWFTLFRSLASLHHGEPPARAHRRLKLLVLDLRETVCVPEWNKRRDDVSSLNGSGGGPSIVSEAENTPIGIKPGWSGRERLCIELLLNGHLIARTSWKIADATVASPFWGESFSFEELPELSKLTLLIFRHERSQPPCMFGTVDLLLVTEFTQTEDEFYPIRSINGRIIGEIRLNVGYQELVVLAMEEYALPDHALSLVSAGPGLFYTLASRGAMDGTSGLLSRLGLAQGTLMPYLLDKCTLEGNKSAYTLFRGNTPFTKLLESTMRLLCGRFLAVSIGSTIRRVIEGGIEPRLYHSKAGHYGFGLSVNLDGYDAINRLAESCWTDMYSNRHVFPDFLRHVFAHLFNTVKSVHEDKDEKLRYKAVSCFVFLRLIGPALMSPHLFGLSDSLLPIHLQRTLTLLAKILHALAFFSERDLTRDPDLGLFRPFIHDNSEGMVDYLATFATTLDDWQARPAHPTVLEHFLDERKRYLPTFFAESIPWMTIAGPVDVGADSAVLAEMLYKHEHRRSRSPSSSPALQVTSQSIHDNDQRFVFQSQSDMFLTRVHRLAFSSQKNHPNDRSETSVVSRLSLSIQPPPPSSIDERTKLRTKLASPTSWKWFGLSSPKFDTVDTSPLPRPLSTHSIPCPATGHDELSPPLSGREEPPPSPPRSVRRLVPTASLTGLSSLSRRSLTARQSRPSLPSMTPSGRDEEDPTVPRTRINQRTFI